MDRKFHIIVEGKEDLFFMKNYLDHIEKSSLSIHLEQTEGKYNLVKEDVRLSIAKGREIIIVFDANEDTKEEVSEKLQGLKYKLFLFPDNRSKGNIEDLLEQIILSGKRDIFECFENYEKCLKEKNYPPPGKKAKIYSYKKVLGAFDEKHEEEQFKPEYWDFDNSALDPLKRFLLENLG